MLKNLHYCIVVVGDENVICGGEHNTSKRYYLPAYYTLLLESIGFTYTGECIWDKGCSKRSYRKNETPVYPFTVMPKQCCDHILIFQKRELSNEPVPCPCCGGTDVKPYGYTKKGLKNWKCDDPECSGKNEKGFGKVFNEGSILRKDVKSEKNAIPPEMLEKWHRNVVEIDTFTSCGRANRQRYLPVDIVEMAMRYFGGVGDYVLDPFSGLGTTVLTAIELKRKFLCIESDDKDIDIFLSNCTRLRRNMEMRLAEMETADP